MHVLIITSSYPLAKGQVGGIFYRTQVQALKAQGVQVGVVAPNFVSLRRLGDYLRSCFKKGGEYIDDGVPVVAQEFPSFVMAIPYVNYWIWRYFAKKLAASYIRKHGIPDIIHAHTTVFAGVFAEYLSKKIRRPFVITEHASHFGRHRYPRWQLTLAKKAVLSADQFIVVSAFLKKSIESSLRVDLTRAKVIPNVLASHFTELPINVRAIPQKACFINIGSMNENKGQARLIEAFSILLQDYSDVSLIIVGNGELEKSLKERVAQLGLECQVEFKGHVQNESIPELFKQCDALVVASRYETFGVVAIEAMAAGLPVITTPCGGVESVLPAGAGFVSNGYGAKDIATSMREFVGVGVGRSAKEIQLHAVSLYGPVNVASQLLRVYEQLVRPH
jgi:glycosyltransferase involved in cell wall biosynthesis